MPLLGLACGPLGGDGRRGGEEGGEGLRGGAAVEEEDSLAALGGDGAKLPLLLPLTAGGGGGGGPGDNNSRSLSAGDALEGLSALA